MHKHARDYDHIDNELDWKGNGKAGVGAAASLDTEPSSGSSELKYARDYSRVDGEADWNASKTVVFSPKRHTVEPSSGDVSGNHARIYDAGAADFEHGAGTGAKGLVDTTPSEGSAMHTHAREYDVVANDLDWTHQGHSAAPPIPSINTEPSSGSIADTHIREFDILDVKHDWNSSGTHESKPMLNTFSSDVSTAKRPTRLYDRIASDGDWKRGAPTTKGSQNGVEASVGSVALKNVREYDILNGDDDWKRPGVLATADAYDTEPSAGSIDYNQVRTFQRLNQDLDWAVSGIDASKPDKCVEVSQGNVLLRHAREYDASLAPLFHGKMVEKVALDTTPSSGSVQSSYARDFVQVDTDLDFKHNGRSEVSKDQIGIDTEPSLVATALTSTRDFVRISHDVDWKFEKNTKVLNNMSVDTEPSRGSITGINPREYTTLNKRLDWKLASSSSQEQATLNTEPSDGSIALAHTRNYDTSVAPMTHAKPSPARGAIDTTASSGSAASNHARDFDRIDPDLDWKAQPSSSSGKELFDTEPSNGSSALRHAREYKNTSGDGDWSVSTHASTMMPPLDSEPSQGSVLQTHARNYDGFDPDLDWKAGGRNALRERNFDSTPSDGNSLNNPAREYDGTPAFNVQKPTHNSDGCFDTTPLDADASTHSRDFNRFSPDKDWKVASNVSMLRSIALDTVASLGNPLNNHPRDFDSSFEERWDVALGGDEDTGPLDTTTSSGVHPSMLHARDFDKCDPDLDWATQSSNAEAAIMRTPGMLEPNETHVSNHTPRQLAHLPASLEWKPAMTAKTLVVSSPAAPAAVDVAKARSFPFRQLQKYQPEDDWNKSTKAIPKHMREEFPRDLRLKRRTKQRSKIGERSRSSKHDATPVSEVEKQALIAYLEHLASSSNDVEEEIVAVFNMLADVGCTEAEIADVFERCKEVAQDC